MPYYEVRVSETRYINVNVIVEADDPVQAAEMAQDNCARIDINHTEEIDDWEVTDVKVQGVVDLF